MAAALNEFARHWWDWMAPMLWQASLLIVLISLLDWLIRRWAWPQLRYALWLLVLLKLVLPPWWGSPVGVISRMEPAVRRSLEARGVGSREAGETAPLSLSQGAAAGGKSVESIPAGPPSAVSEGPESAGREAGRTGGLSPRSWALLGWIAGMLLFAALLVLKMARLRRWHRLQEERQIPEWFHRLLVETAETLRLGRIPAIVFSKDAVTPAVYGMFRPVLLLPSGYLKRLSREEAEHVLLHELCHLKRGDLWMHGAYMILHVVYWFNPLLIWTRREMKHVREICCDLSVAAVLAEKTQRYRLTLLNTARELLTETVEPGLGLLGVFEEPFKIVTRLRWLEKEPSKLRKWIPLLSLCASLSLAAVIIPMSGPGAPHFSGDQPLFPETPDGGSVLYPDSGTDSVKEPDFKITLKRTEPMTAVILPKVGPPDPQFDAAMTELKERMKKQGLKPDGDFFFRMWTNLEEVPESRASWEVGCPVKPTASAKPPLEIVRLPEMQVASAEIQGMFASNRTWEAFAERISAMGMVPAFPPAVEVYKAKGDSKPVWWKTEMQMLSFKPQAGYPGMDIRIRETDPCTALVLPVQGSYSQNQNAVERVKRYIRDHKLRTGNRWFCLYYSDPSRVTPAEYLCDIGCVLDPDFVTGLQVDPPFELRRIEGDSVAAVAFGHPPDTEFPHMPFIYQSLMMGYMISGSLGQTWSEDPLKDDQDIRSTEFFFPAKTLAGFAGDMEEFGRSVADWHSKNSAASAQRGIPAEGDSTENGSSDLNVTEDEKGPIGNGWSEKFLRFFAGGSGASNTGPLFRIEKADPCWAVILPAEGSMDQQPVVFEKLLVYLRANGIETTGPLFTNQYTDDAVVQHYELRWDAGVTVRDTVAVKAPFRCVRIPQRNVVRIHYAKGISEKTLSVQFAAWLYHHDLRNRMPNRMVWTHGIPQPGREVDRLDIEVRIEKMPEPYPEVRLFNRSEKECQELILPSTGSLAHEGEVMEKVRRYVAENTIETLGDIFIQLHNDPEGIPESEVRWDVGIPIRGEVRTEDPFRIEMRPGRKSACAYFEGDPMDIPDRFWIAYVLNFTMNGYTGYGYPRLVFRERQAENRWKVELQWAVRE